MHRKTTKKEKEGLVGRLLGWPKERILGFIDAQNSVDPVLSADAITNLKAEVERVFKDGVAKTERRRCATMIKEAFY